MKKKFFPIKIVSLPIAAMAMLVGLVGIARWHTAQAGAGDAGEYFFNQADSRSATVTISNGGGISPGIVSWTAHGLTAGSPITFTLSGMASIASPLNAANYPYVDGSNYYVCSGTTLLTDSFAVAASIANAFAGNCKETTSASAGTIVAHNLVGVPSADSVIPPSPGTSILGLNLTAGNWMVCGEAVAEPNAATVITNVSGGISTAENSFTPRRPALGAHNNWVGSVTGKIIVVQTGCRQALITTPTIFYLTGWSLFTNSWQTMNGFISAWRMQSL